MKQAADVWRHLPLNRVADKTRRLMVAIAQLVERQVVVLDVAGSSPVSHPKRLFQNYV